MGCSASSLLPINKAINPAETPSEGEKKSSTNGVNGAENTVQSNGVTKIPPSIPEESVKEGEEKDSSETSQDNETSKSEKPDKEVSKEVVTVGSSTGVENPDVVVAEEKEKESEQEEGEKNNGTIDELPDAKHEIPNDIEPSVSTTETSTTITIEEVTKPPSPTEMQEELPSETIQEEQPQEENKTEPTIPIISNEVPAFEPLIAEQTLKLPDEGK